MNGRLFCRSVSGQTSIMPYCFSRGLAVFVLVLLTGWGRPADAAAEEAGQSAGANSDLPASTYWRTDAQAAQSAECRAVLAGLRGQLRHQATTAFMAVRGDQIVFSEGPIARPSLVRSVRKSLLAMLYGQAVQDGRINLDATLAELGIDDVGGLLPIEREARVRDLLAARSGVYHPAANPGDDAAGAPPRGSQLPGQYFLYNNWDFNVAGDVYEQRTGRNLYDAFAQDIAAPLGLEDFDRARHHRSGKPSRSSHLAYPFYLSARDMARIGELMLVEGQWQGRQIVPAGWTHLITTPVTRSAEMHPPNAVRRRASYGLLWWMPEVPDDSVLAGSYFAWGYFGQWILAIPKSGMVIVHNYETVAREDESHPPTVPLRSFLEQARMIAEAPCR
ncbi:serine hydrolase [Bradyrhizobium sp. Arg816]|uniref:serine hydrolase domain-containing protein n=1 Tax=Bradyrhizobium sp. Arg816 TaxID=2998491 RepID=UPI00249EDAF5|nr:serine hydrolase [Bradyrhizobium sp. Arg816]MDI3560808.1 serine hydrolase [Bradyrhizobium sp. Arg816]